jgi:hypothetical protein
VRISEQVVERVTSAGNCVIVGRGSQPLTDLFSVEKSRLRRAALLFAKMAQTDAYKSVALLWTKTHSFPQLESDLG